MNTPFVTESVLKEYLKDIELCWNNFKTKQTINDMNVILIDSVCDEVDYEILEEQSKYRRKLSDERKNKIQQAKIIKEI